MTRSEPRHPSRDMEPKRPEASGDQHGPGRDRALPRRHLRGINPDLDHPRDVPLVAAQGDLNLAVLRPEKCDQRVEIDLARADIDRAHVELRVLLAKRPGEAPCGRSDHVDIRLFDDPDPRSRRDCIA